MEFASCNMCVRMLMAFFERDKYSARSVDGQRYIRALLRKITANKAAEDLQLKVRNNARANVNTKLSLNEIQNTICNSGMLEGEIL